MLQAQHTFDGDGRLVRLCVLPWGLPTKLAPYFGLSMPRADQLPHQLEAIYDYLLKPVRGSSCWRTTPAALGKGNHAVMPRFRGRKSVWGIVSIEHSRARTATAGTYPGPPAMKKFMSMTFARVYRRGESDPVSNSNVGTRCRSITPAFSP